MNKDRIKDTWPVLTNQRPAFRSCDLYWPIRGQYQVMWSEFTNQMPLFRSYDLLWPIRGRYSGQVICIDQSEASIWVAWPVWTIRGQDSGHMTCVDQSSIEVTWPVWTNQWIFSLSQGTRWIDKTYSILRPCWNSSFFPWDCSPRAKATRALMKEPPALVDKLTIWRLRMQNYKLPYFLFRGWLGQH